MSRIRASSIGFCVSAVVMLSTCHKPRSEGYRRIELFSAGKSQVTFMCLVRAHQPDTFVGTTPWVFELDVGTGPECMCGTPCRITKTSVGTDSMWMRAFDRESLRLDKYVADLIYFDMRSWECYKGKP